jgi:toxin CptA
MHNAPSVSYPLGRFSLPLGLLLLQAGLSGIFLVVWASAQPIGWTGYVGAGGCVLACALNHRIWRGQRGWLCWDGAQWHWRDERTVAFASMGTVGVGEVKTVLDWQNILLLRWQPLTYAGQPAVRWLWLGRRASESNWLALRRAVWMPHRPGE